CDRAVVQSLRLVWNDEVKSEIDGIAESLALGTRAKRGVKREQPRCWCLVTNSAGLALEALREPQLPGSLTLARRGFKNNFATFTKTDFCGVHSAGAPFSRNHQAVHQSKHGLGEVQVQQRFRRGELKNLPALKEAV